MMFFQRMNVRGLLDDWQAVKDLLFVLMGDLVLHLYFN